MQIEQPKKRYQCGNCDLSFSRPSHLDRHVASHNPRYQRNCVCCPHCEKGFARNDVLLRHLRAVHQVQTPPKKSARKSCSQCIRRKLKCNRTQPCQSCINSQSHCAYHDVPVPSTSSTPPESTPEQDNDILQDTIHQTIPFQSNNSRYDLPLTPEEERHSAFDDLEIPRYGRPSERRNLLQTEDNSFGPYTNLTTQTQSNNEESILCSMSHDVPTTMNLGSGGLDWLDFQLQEPIIQQASSVLTNTTYSIIPLTDSNIGNSHGYGSIEIHDPGALPIDSSRNFTTHANSQALPASQQWPFDQNRERFPPRCQLPPLRDILHGSVASDFGQNAGALEELVQLLSVPYIPKLENSPYDATRLTAFHLLKEAIDRFLAEFHPILPILHIPTWNLFKCPTVLLASMACIGAMLRDDQDSFAESKAFSEICTRMIFWLVSSLASLFP